MIAISVQISWGVTKPQSQEQISHDHGQQQDSALLMWWELSAPPPTAAEPYNEFGTETAKEVKGLQVKEMGCIGTGDHSDTTWCPSPFWLLYLTTLSTYRQRARQVEVPGTSTLTVGWRTWRTSWPRKAPEIQQHFSWHAQMQRTSRSWEGRHRRDGEEPTGNLMRMGAA